MATTSIVRGHIGQLGCMSKYTLPNLRVRHFATPNFVMRNGHSPTD